MKRMGIGCYTLWWRSVSPLERCQVEGGYGRADIERWIPVLYVRLIRYGWMGLQRGMYRNLVSMIGYRLMVVSLSLNGVVTCMYKGSKTEYGSKIRKKE